MNLHEIVKLHLVTNGFDGLFNGCQECACTTDNLFPCECPDEKECQPGYRVECDPDDGLDFLIVEKVVKCVFCGKSIDSTYGASDDPSLAHYGCIPDEQKGLL